VNETPTSKKRPSFTVVLIRVLTVEVVVLLLLGVLQSRYPR
jgi:hypothetical protein